MPITACRQAWCSLHEHACCVCAHHVICAVQMRNEKHEALRVNFSNHAAARTVSLSNAVCSPRRHTDTRSAHLDFSQGDVGVVVGLEHRERVAAGYHSRALLHRVSSMQACHHWSLVWAAAETGVHPGCPLHRCLHFGCSVLQGGGGAEVSKRNLRQLLCLLGSRQGDSYTQFRNANMLTLQTVTPDIICCYSC